jgi:hypothetical protein
MIDCGPAGLGLFGIVPRGLSLQSKDASKGVLDPLFLLSFSNG